MQFSIVSDYRGSSYQGADVLCIPLLQEKRKEEESTAEKKQKTESGSNSLLEEQKRMMKVWEKELVLKEGEIFLVHQEEKGCKEKKIVWIGLGEKKEISKQSIRSTYAQLLRLCKAKKWKQCAILLPDLLSFSTLELTEIICEGMSLADYEFSKKTEENGQETGKEKEEISVLFIGEKKESSQEVEKRKEAIDRRQIITEGVNLARDLVNGNAHEVTPQYLGQVAKNLLLDPKSNKSVKVTVFDKKQIEKEEIGLLLAVGRGAEYDPSLIFIEYRGNPDSKERTALIGKGVTFDTGGLNLKPTGYIEDMRTDMGGAAAVLGVMQNVIRLQLKTNVIGVIPTAENAIDGKSYKPGDVYTSYHGKTVEIGNTDAEGRLILADAISYTCSNLQPTRIIDLATLTGAMVISLGAEASGLMSNNDQLSEQLFQAGEETFERVWRFPLHKEYRKLLDSKIADIKNCGGRGAGSITAALFLKEFLINEDQVAWAHIDIAGTAYLSKPHSLHSSSATGVGVRLLTQFLSTLK